MKTPTIEEIEAITSGWTYKPLSELYKDEEACRKIFEKVTDGRFSRVKLCEGHIRIQGFRLREGAQEWQTEVTVMRGIVHLDGHNVTDFELVDLIRSLGYSA